MLGRLGAMSFGAQLLTGVTGERHSGIVITVFATVGRPPCWAGSGRGPMALSCSLASRMSSLLASSPLSVCRHYARSDYGFALRRAVVHWRHVREFFDIILIVFATVCRSLSWLAWSAAPRVLIVPSTIGRPPCWAGSGRGPSTHRYSPTLQTSSTSASSSLSR
mgnify:CR=1 FL=1